MNWDQSRLNTAIRERLQYPGRSEAQIINQAAYWVARNSMGRTHYTEQFQIDNALATRIAPRFTKTGRQLPYRRAKRNYSSAPGTARNPAVPLGVLIVQAQARRGSNFNLRTGHRYFRSTPIYAKGIPRRLGNALMAAAINRLIKSRHSSTKFIRSGWLAALQILRPLVGKAPPLDTAAGNPGVWRNPHGTAYPAQEGRWVVQATIVNDIGGAGANAASHNAALWRIGAWALQASIDEEATKMFAYIAEKEAQHAARFNATAR